MKGEHPGIFRRFFSNIFLLLNILAVVWLFLCLLAAYVSPAHISYLSLFSLTTPFALIFNLIFIVFWLFSRHKARLLMSLLTIVACYKVTTTIIGFNYFERNDMIPRQNTIRVMSWNSHGMGIFEWSQRKVLAKKILEYIKDVDADILCMPEYSVPIDNNEKSHAERIIRDNGYVDYRFTPDNSLNDKVYLGTAVFSKYPFKNYESHRLSEFISMLQGDIQLPDNKMIRVFFVHLTTFGLTDQDKDYIDEVKGEKKLSEALNQSDFFVDKFKRAFVQRANEADKAVSIIKKSPYPVLLCGDFNDLPGSYTYTTMRGERKDAFLEKGTGMGRTYDRILPTLRIDHVFYDPTGLRLKGFECPHTDLSDHNPIITNFEIIAKPQS